MKPVLPASPVAFLLPQVIPQMPMTTNASTEYAIPFHTLFAAIMNSIQPPQPVLPTSQQLELAIRDSIRACLPNKNSKITVQGHITIVVDAADPIDVKLDAPQVSKRKSYQPVKICCSPVSQPPTTPDSGALDLSRAGSITSDSAPVTPFKEEQHIPTYEGFEAPGKLGRRRISAGGGCRRPFSCNLCGEGDFKCLQDLETHTLAAHGSYRCHVCSAKFTQRSNLQRHALKHVGFKPFECRVCGKSYFRKDHLMRHMEVMHPSFAARDNINVYLTSSESLDFLNSNNKTSGEESSGATV